MIIHFIFLKISILIHLRFGNVILCFFFIVILFTVENMVLLCIVRRALVKILQIKKAFRVELQLYVYI